MGGGLRSVDDCKKVLLAGAEKVNVNTAAVARPELIAEASAAFGAQGVVLSMDVLGVPSRRHTLGVRNRHARRPHAHGHGRNRLGKAGETLGAGELVVNSIDADGTKEGYELRLTRMMAEAVGIPVIASGGGGNPEHLYQVLTEGKADAALVASILHYGEYSIREVKEYLHNRGIKVRLI